MQLFREAILLYLSSLERKRFMKLKKAQLFYLVIKLMKLFLLFQGLIRDDKLREGLVSYCFSTENYIDVIGELLISIINKHNQKNTTRKPSQKVLLHLGTLHGKRHLSGKCRDSLAIADLSSTNGCSEFHLCTIFTH